MLVSLVPWRSGQALADHQILKTYLSSHERKHAVWCARHRSFLSWFLVPVAVDAHARQMIVFKAGPGGPVPRQSTISVGGAGLSYQTQHGADQRCCGDRTSGFAEAEERKSAHKDPGRRRRKRTHGSGKLPRCADRAWKRRLGCLIRNACNWVALKGRGCPEGDLQVLQGRAEAPQTARRGSACCGSLPPSSAPDGARQPAKDVFRTPRSDADPSPTATHGDVSVAPVC